MKRGLILITIILLILPVCFASLNTDMDTVQGYVNDYNQGTITAPQLVVYLDYTEHKIYESLEEKDNMAFTESNIQGIFEKAMHNNDYELVFSTDDFDVVFNAHPFVRHDKEYYEMREDMSDSYYNIGFHLRPTKLEEDLNGIILEYSKFSKNLVKVADGENVDFEGMRVQFAEIKQKTFNVKDCEELMDKLMLEEESMMMDNLNQDLIVGEEIIGGDGMMDNKPPQPKLQPKPQPQLPQPQMMNPSNNGDQKMFSTIIKQNMKTECWNDHTCENVCEDEESCFENCHNEQYCEEKCDSECHEEESCDNVCETTIEFNEENGLNETIETCYDVCKPKEVCNNNCWQDCQDEQVCEDVCETRQNCRQECEDIETCEEYPDGELRIQGVCGKDHMGNEFTDIYINANGPGLDYFNELNNMDSGDKGCEQQVDGLVELRKALQKDIDNDFARWYFEEFIGNDPEKVVGGDGLRRVLRMLTNNEEQISENLFCKHQDEIKWPAGFEQIELEYMNDHVNLEVWEKMIPVEWNPVKHWTTLYKYAWVPDKELVKKLIDFQLTKKNSFGPDAKEIADIKADEGKMEVINRLANKYGGSFDVMIELVDAEDNSIVAKKYMKINPDVAVKIDDDMPEKEDISITIDYDVLYNFITYMNLKVEGDRIEGPHWVHIDEKDGPGNLFSVIGAVSKMWREGVKIRPRYALFKMFFNTKDIVSLMQEAEDDEFGNNYDKNSGSDSNDLGTEQNINVQIVDGGEV
jgi:hypothetical protein